MKIVYVCNIGDDIDDMIAVEYLLINGYLDYVVKETKKEQNNVENWGLI